MTTRRALVIVARYPEPGRVKTRLAATIGGEAAARLYRAFLGDLAERFSSAARRGGYTLVWAVAPGAGDLRAIVGAEARVLPQRGDSFAERLDFVCHDLTGEGMRELVIISSDSPHIPAARVTCAFDLVARGEVALGPAEDGGYYLVGVCAQPRHPNLFLGIQMSTAHVLTDTRARAAMLGLSVGLLPSTFDVDEASALPRLACALARPDDDTADSPRTRAALARLEARGAPASA